MPNFNKVILAGHLTRDWEMRYAKSGSAVGSNAIAVNRKWKNEDGDQQEEVSFFNVTAFGKSAETLDEYTKQGDPILVDGRLKQDTWKDKETEEKRSAVVVIIESFQFLKGGSGDDDKPNRKSRERDDDDRPKKKRKHDYSEDDDSDDSDDDDRSERHGKRKGEPF